MGGGDRVHGKTTSLVGGGSEGSHLVRLDGSAHQLSSLQWGFKEESKKNKNNQ
jgi:hypothetical protein